MMVAEALQHRTALGSFVPWPTLTLLSWVQSIRNRPEINQRVSKAAHIKELSTEIERLKADLFATREKNGIYMNPDECA